MDNDAFVDELPPPNKQKQESNMLDTMATAIVNNMGLLKVGFAGLALGLTWLQRRRFTKQLEQVSRDVRKLGRDQKQK